MALTYPFPNGTVNERNYTKNDIVKLNCASFYAENLGEVPVYLLGRKLNTGEGFSLPFSGVIIEQDVRVTFEGDGAKNLYILQTNVEPCN